MKICCLGFCFDTVDVHRVLLIEKNRGPEHIIGKYNGLGGKNLPDEKPLDAMKREFYEECGLVADWIPFGELLEVKQQYLVYLFAGRGDITKFQQKEDEKLGIFSVYRELRPMVEKEMITPNVAWMIPMAQNILLTEEVGYYKVEH